jgi:hypothetical protein
MSDDPFDDVEEFDDDVGLGEDDKKHGASGQLDWFKGEKGRSYRVGLLYFHPVQASIINAARKAAREEKKELDKDKVIALIKSTLAKRAEEMGKAPDQLTEVDKLDLGHVRFKKVLAHYKEGVGYALSRLGKDGPENDKIWQMMGDVKKYFTTVALIYPTKVDGKVVKERLAHDWRVMPWRCHSGIYRDLHEERASLAENKIRIVDQDLKLKCTNTGFQNFDISAAGPAIWRREPKYQAMVLSAAVALYEKLVPFRELSTADLRIKLGLSSGDAQGDDVSDIDFGDLMGEDAGDGPMGDV